MTKAELRTYPSEFVAMAENGVWITHDGIIVAVARTFPPVGGLATSWYTSLADAKLTPELTVTTTLSMNDLLSDTLILCNPGKLLYVRKNDSPFADEIAIVTLQLGPRGVATDEYMEKYPHTIHRGLISADDTSDYS